MPIQITIIGVAWFTIAIISLRVQHLQQWATHCVSTSENPQLCLHVYSDILKIYWNPKAVLIYNACLLFLEQSLGIFS